MASFTVNFDFRENIEECLEQIQEQHADGGGDYPEAVHTALDNAVSGHSWREEAVKLCFLVLDAPPHTEEEVQGVNESLRKTVMNAAEASGSSVPITSIDNDKVILEGIYDGRLLGSACYSSTAPAFWCMSAMVNLLNGVEVPSIYWYANMKVTKDNVVDAFEHYHAQTLDDYLAGN